MHADERNRAMSEALGEDVYHYHLHIMEICGMVGFLEALMEKPQQKPNENVEA